MSEADATMEELLAAIDYSLRNGVAISGACLAMMELCGRLGYDVDKLVYVPNWYDYRIPARGDEA